MDLNTKPRKLFKDCKAKSYLKFDFYIESLNTCIEFDGIQHELPIERFGGVHYLDYIKECDSIKSDYCLKNKINLIRISYLRMNEIENILSSYLLQNEITLK